MSANGLQFDTSYKSLVDDFSKPIAVFDESLALVYSNRQYQAIFDQAVTCLNDLVKGVQPENLDASLHYDIDDASWTGRVFGAVNRTLSFHLKLIRLKQSGKSRYVGVFNAEPMRLVSYTSERAQFDDLTELPNRYGFIDALNQRIIDANGEPDFAVLYLDLDHFKDINELHGHLIGDELLKLCADKVRQMLRKNDSLARLSGDEFAAIVDCKESHEMQYLCHRIMRYFERPVFISGQSFQLTISMGVVFYPEQGETAQEIIINAEKAMFSAKQRGRAQFQLFDRKQSQKVEKQHRIAESLRHVLTNEPEQFSAVYQPLYHLQTGQFIGVEVLSRWASPEFGQVSPAEFIALAESRGLINHLSSHIFKYIAKDLLMTRPDPNGHRPLLAINVSAQQIGDHTFEDDLQIFHDIVKNAGWQLEIELTESQLMTLSNSLIEQLESWQNQGMRIAIDDFGTGYSCLAYLHMLPVNKLKIDRQFLQTQTESRKEDQIMYAIMSMAKALGIEVLAEGIETMEQFRRLQQLGCVSGQGFGLAKPQAWHPSLMRSLPET